MVQLTFSSLYYHLSQSFLGYVTNNMKAISVACDYNQRKVHVKIFLHSIGSELDKECAAGALSEADSMFDDRIDYSVEFITNHKELTVTDRQDYYIFMKYDK